MNMNAKTKRMKRGTAMLLSMLMTFSSANLQTFAWGGRVNLTCQNRNPQARAMNPGRRKTKILRTA